MTRRLPLLVVGITAIVLLISGCDSPLQPESTSKADLAFSIMEGGASLPLAENVEPLAVPVYSSLLSVAATVTVTNDADRLYFEIVAADGWFITDASMAVADALEAIPQTTSGQPVPDSFPYQVSYGTPATSVGFIISLGAWEPETVLYIAAYAGLSYDLGDGTFAYEPVWSDGIDFPGDRRSKYFTYTVQDTAPPVVVEDDFRTQTQGGWGSGSHGVNPGSYRDAHFAGAFPEGLTIGDTDGYAIVLTSSYAVEEFLPQGRKPAALNESATDPDSRITVLAGQVAALALSVGLDLYDPDFGRSAGYLKDQVVADESSPFFGESVESVLAIANAVLGATSSAFTPGEVNDCVTSINETYIDGIKHGDFLVLP